MQETTGDSVGTQDPIQFGEDDGFKRQLTIALGNVQYGQSRDIYLRYEATPELRGAIKLALEGEEQPEPPIVSAVLEYTRFTPTVHQARTHRSIVDFTTLPPAEIAYHVSRSAIISFISSLFPIRDDGEHIAIAEFSPEGELEGLINNLPAAESGVIQDPRCLSLMEDLCGDGQKGQIKIACKPEFMEKWGVHYLPSLAGAHAHQVCNSFKDPGPLMYGTESPLFISCRDRLDTVFDTLPAPTPSKETRYKGTISMSKYHNSFGVCFAGSTRVTLAATGAETQTRKNIDEVAPAGGTIRIGRLRVGMRVQTPKGPRTVAAVLKTRVRRTDMCLVGGLMVTPWHPISLDGEGWAFPAHVAHRPLRYTGSIYSVLLEPGSDVDAHAIMVDGVWGVTLGHGLLDARESQDVRAHQFFGNYDMVSKDLARLQRDMRGVLLGGGVKRDSRTGLVNGFKRAALRPSRALTPALRKRPIYA